jgi:hypothetical protein
LLGRESRSSHALTAVDGVAAIAVEIVLLLVGDSPEGRLLVPYTATRMQDPTASLAHTAHP